MDFFFTPEQDEAAATWPAEILADKAQRRADEGGRARCR